MEARRLSWSNYISYPCIKKAALRKDLRPRAARFFLKIFGKHSSPAILLHFDLVAGPVLATSYALVIEDRSSNGWLPLAEFLCQNFPVPSQFVHPSFVCARGLNGSRVQLGHAVEGSTQVHSLIGQF